MRRLATIAGTAAVLAASILGALLLAGPAAAQDDDFQIAHHCPAGLGMRSNRAKKASVVRASASSRDQPRISASLSSTWPT